MLPESGEARDPPRGGTPLMVDSGLPVKMPDLGGAESRQWDEVPFRVEGLRRESPARGVYGGLFPFPRPGS